MNAHSKRGVGAREAELPSCRSTITCPPLSGHSGTSAKNCDRRIFLKMNGMGGVQIRGLDFDLLGEDRKRLRAFAISWEKLANRRARFRFNATAAANCSGSFRRAARHSM